MRPPAVEKLGFCPISVKVIEALQAWFAPAKDGRLLDPCAGEGLAAGRSCLIPLRMSGHPNYLPRD
jgi:hypothetical protein